MLCGSFYNICCYDPKQYRLFLCTSTFFPGTGDYEDNPEICNDREMDCYCIWLEDMTNIGNISSGAGYYEHLSAYSNVVLANWYLL